MLPLRYFGVICSQGVPSAKLLVLGSEATDQNPGSWPFWPTKSSNAQNPHQTLYGGVSHLPISALLAIRVRQHCGNRNSDRPKNSASSIRMKAKMLHQRLRPQKKLSDGRIAFSSQGVRPQTDYSRERRDGGRDGDSSRQQGRSLTSSNRPTGLIQLGGRSVYTYTFLGPHTVCYHCPFLVRFYVQCFSQAIKL